MTKRRPKTDSSGQVQTTDEQRIAWVRLKLNRYSARLRLFNRLLELQSLTIKKIGIDKKSLTLVERYGASSTGVGWDVAEKKYNACPNSKDAERKVWQNVTPRLAETLYDLYPPGYHAPILVVTEGDACWLTGLDSTPKPHEENSDKEQFGNWRCTIDDETMKTGPIHLPSAPSRRIRQRLVVDGAWKPPKHFTNFQQFKQSQWEQYRGNNPKLDNGQTVFFSNFKRDGEVFEIRARNGEYADYVATIKSLDHSVRLPDGSEKKASDLLLVGWDAKTNLLPLPVASPVAQDLMIVTKDEKVLVRDDKRCQQWTVSASAIPHKAKDGDDPTTLLHGAIRRRTYEELGLHIDPTQIFWMAFGIGRKFGRNAFLGQIKVTKTEQEIRRCFENRSERDDVREIKFIPLEIADVQKFLKTRDCLYFLWLGLHLCLWRKFPNRVKIFTH